MDPRTRDASWFRFLSRWSLVQAALAIALMVVYLGGVGFDPNVPQAYAELIQASRKPEAYRVAMVLDAVTWLSLGGTFIAFGALFFSRALTRSVFAAACGIGMLSGSIGGSLRLGATSALAGRYATGSPEQQAAVQQSYLLLDQIVQAHFTTGHLLQALAYGLIAWIALSLQGFPRWIAVWLALTALSAAAFFALDTVGMFLFPLLLLHIVVFVVALNLAMAWAFWRRPPVLATELSERAEQLNR